ncbi:chemotaxis-specific protein-glutamate methyltransferase CheB [Natronospira bacteriovora]|uniref:Protein-glutamate methylesterase/protein-glutamine glutaminase n=1 Tax=Natronospira bacteriovora TaxID=3069753 RepID=A0ABU0W5Z0_9GAMM|nr:chemotaxis-specific protein-glutamate methyltransferase CheB [Natronospira sp. AB-CW4]MDQ2069421.1 chemotaxis-specific protein-glutamate methyltransferase CheB [Natronospira sp. AB-CW4]
MGQTAERIRSKGEGVTRVLVVDDSALMRRQLMRMFDAEPDMEVVMARDGADALERVRDFRPHVVTLDIHMPVMDGLECLSRIMTEMPTPVVMVSSLTEQGALATLEAMELGAVDYIQKPGGTVTVDMERVRRELIEKVRAAATARIGGVSDTEIDPAEPVAVTSPRRAETMPVSREGVVLIGVSTGGPRTLESILPELPADFPWPVLVAQHMPSSFTGVFAKRMNERCQLTVTEVDKLTDIRPGGVYIARGDADMVMTNRNGVLKAMPVPSDESGFWHPSVNRLVKSAIEQLPSASIAGVLLTGMGDDGAESMAELYHGGGFTIAESEATAVVWGMPKALIDRGAADMVIPSNLVAQQLLRHLRQVGQNAETA